MKNKLKVARAEMDITQGELAEKINVSRQTINAIESGKYVPSTVLALKMAKVFGKNVEEIFFWKKMISQNCQKSLFAYQTRQSF